MSSRVLWAVVACLVLSPCEALAFDPFTIAAVVSAGASVVSSVSEVAGEVAASADAFGELYGEIDPDAALGEDGNSLVRQIQEIESLAYEAGYTKEELEQLTKDSANSKDAKKLAATLKAITRAVRAGKRVAKLFMKLDQKAKLSQVETAQIEREQLVVLYRQLRTEHERDFREIKESLKDQKDKRDQIKTIKEEEKKTGAKSFGRTGVLSFPKQDSIVEEALRMATQMRPVLFSLILFVFLSRTVAYQFSFFGPARYGDLIRDALVCAVLLMIFPELVRACVSICGDVAAKVGMNELHDVEPGKLDFPVEIGLSVKTRLVLEWLFQWIKYIAFVTTKFLANFGLGFLILLFPIVIFCSQMLNFSIAWPLFLGGFLSVCLWPLFWNATGSLALMLWRKQDASLSDQIATILFSILQFLSPLVGIATLKGQPISKSIQSAGNSVWGSVSGGASVVAQQLAGFAKGSVGAYGGGTAGRVLSYPVNQSAGRLMAARSRTVESVRMTRESNQPVLVPALKSAAHGFITNSRKSAPSGGIAKDTLQILKGFKRQPLLRGESRSGERKGGGNV